MNTYERIYTQLNEFARNPSTFCHAVRVARILLDHYKEQVNFLTVSQAKENGILLEFKINNWCLFIEIERRGDRLRVWGRELNGESNLHVRFFKKLDQHFYDFLDPKIKVTVVSSKAEEAALLAYKLSLAHTRSANHSIYDPAPNDQVFAIASVMEEALRECRTETVNQCIQVIDEVFKNFYQAVLGEPLPSLEHLKRQLIIDLKYEVLNIETE